MSAIPWYDPKLIKRFPKYHSATMHIVPLLLAIPEVSQYPLLGWYFGGLMNQWRIDGSPSEFHPQAWMPLPEMP